MIPNNEPFAALGHKAVALADRTAGAVIHSITAMPLRFHRAFENVRRSEIWRKQSQLKTRARWAIVNLRRVIGRPPDFVGAGRRRVVGTRAAGNGRVEAIRVVRRVEAKPLRHIHVVVVAAIKVVSDADLLQVVETGNLAGLSFRFGQGGQEQRRKNRNDGDDDQQLDESKCP